VSAYPFADGPDATASGDESGIVNLTCAARSASEVAAWLLGEYNNLDAPLASLRILLSPVDGEQINPDVSKLMGGAEAPATRSAVETHFFEFRKDCRSNADNVAFVYIAGHGWQLSRYGAIVLLNDFGKVGKPYLYGAINVVECQKDMDEGENAHHQLWFSDACRLPPRALDEFKELSGAYHPGDARNGTVASSVLLLSASERAGAWGEKGAKTIFCQALLAALRREAGEGFAPAVKPPSEECDQWHVPIAALQRYLQRKTEELIAGREEPPRVDMLSLHGDFVLPCFTPPATRRAKVLQTIPAGPPINAIAWDPDDGRRLVVATNRETISAVWNAGEAKESLVIQDRWADSGARRIVDVAFSRCGDRLATAISYAHRAAGSVVWDKGAVKLWDTANGELVLEIGSRVVATKVAFSPDGAWLATAGADKRAYIWNAGEANGKPWRHFSHDGAVTAVAFNVDGTRLATASADGTARIWDVAGDQFELLPHGKEVTAVSFNKDGTRLATASADGIARIWDVADGSQLKLPLLRHNKEITAVSFNKDGTRLATGSADHTVRIWDVADGSQLEKLDHEEAVGAVAFNPDGTQLATVSADHRARIWDVTGI
jgi:NifU-like protein involved in Fe-S cluster formation